MKYVIYVFYLVLRRLRLQEIRIISKPYERYERSNFDSFILSRYEPDLFN